MSYNDPCLTCWTKNSFRISSFLCHQIPQLPYSLGILAHRNWEWWTMEPKWPLRFVSVIGSTPNAHPLTFGGPGSLGIEIKQRYFHQRGLPLYHIQSPWWIGTTTKMLSRCWLSRNVPGKGKDYQTSFFKTYQRRACWQHIEKKGTYSISP